MSGGAARALGRVLAGGLVLVLVVPLVALVLDAATGDLARARAAGLGDALGLTAWTAAVATAIVFALGTPLAWWTARREGPMARFFGGVVRVTAVAPPAVLGVALLAAFGDDGALGPALASVGVRVEATVAAVVLAQVVVAAPWYVLPLTRAFRAVDPELLFIARSLGATPARAFLRVAVPLASDALRRGLAVAWARAVGELGAILVLGVGVVRTLPVTIAQHPDLSESRAMAVLLLALALAGHLAIRSRLAGRALGSDA